MRENRNHRGNRDRDRDGRGGGGRPNNGRRRSSGGRGGYGRPSGRGGNRGFNRNGNGNERERIAVESGYLVIIDQFMLANPQFATAISSAIDDAPETKDAVIKKFGGTVIKIEPGTYKIDRDPYLCSIIVHQEEQAPEAEVLKGRSTPIAEKICIDTRCLAMIDRELLDDTSLIEKYNSLWFSNQEKACRDLLRDNGGAVRYGFSRNGEELDIFVDTQNAQILVLAPKQEVPAQTEGAEATESTDITAA